MTENCKHESIHFIREPLSVEEISEPNYYYRCLSCGKETRDYRKLGENGHKFAQELGGYFQELMSILKNNT